LQFLIIESRCSRWSDVQIALELESCKLRPHALSSAAWTPLFTTKSSQQITHSTKWHNFVWYEYKYIRSAKTDVRSYGYGREFPYTNTVIRRIQIRCIFVCTVVANPIIMIQSSFRSSLGGRFWAESCLIRQKSAKIAEVFNWGNAWKCAFLHSKGSHSQPLHPIETILILKCSWHWRATRACAQFYVGRFACWDR
jgi:hypothetical protein